MTSYSSENSLIESLEEYKLIIPINLFHNTFSFIFRLYTHSRQVLCHFEFYLPLVYLTKYLNTEDTGQSTSIKRHTILRTLDSFSGFCDLDGEKY